MEGEVTGTPKKEVALDTDWLTALLVACGLLFLFVVIGFDIWHVVHGQFAFRLVPRQPMFWRLSDSFFYAFAMFICVNVVIKSEERILRFAFGLMLIGMLMHFVMIWLHLSSSTARVLTATSSITELPAFVLLAAYGLKWLRSKVVHV
ncbi:MAG: hypothetical protein LAN64_02880 [Acidobacteriia bacterium]|nr:hypothetical protein [Terriglobia bacterium]